VVEQHVVVAGRVGRPHGLDGSFHVTRPVPGLLAVGRAVRVGGRERAIVRRAGTDERPILRLECRRRRSRRTSGTPPT
jgi:16S rRNA processing protein RimM